MSSVQQRIVESATPVESLQEQPTAASSLRVLFIIDSRFPGLGGAEAQAVKLAHALRDNGAHIEFLAPQVIETHSLSDEFEGFKVTRIGYPHLKIVGALIMMTRYGVYLIKRRKEFDCFHIHVTRLLTAVAGLVRPITGVPIITKISGFFEFEGGVLDPKKRWHPLNMLMRLAMKNVDYVQTISIQTRQKLLESGFRENQIAFIPNGIDTSEPLVARANNDVCTIGYCGRLREVKGVHVLLDAYASFKKSNPNTATQLLLAGDGSSEKKLKEQAQALGISDSVKFLGLISDTAAFYPQLDIYVQPSFAEGLPNSVIEAMHAGCPVLASDIGGNQDLLEDGVSGYLFDAGDSEKLASLLAQCVNNPENNQKMGVAGRARIERDFGMNNVIDQLVEVYSGQQN